VRAPAPTRVESAIFYYPRWQLRIDGAPTPAELSPTAGLIRFRLPPGEHRVELALRPTPLRSAALAVSLASLALLLGAAAIFPAWRRRARPAS
jgi:hypothetical protein